jgi:hypothetical protein
MEPAVLGRMCSDTGGNRRLQNMEPAVLGRMCSDTGGDRRLQNMEPAVLGRMCAGGDYAETVNICLQTYSTGV